MGLRGMDLSEALIFSPQASPTILMIALPPRQPTSRCRCSTLISQEWVKNGQSLPQWIATLHYRALLWMDSAPSRARAPYKSWTLITIRISGKNRASTANASLWVHLLKELNTLCANARFYPSGENQAGIKALTTNVSQWAHSTPSKAESAPCKR